MKNFSVINTEGERLLRESDTSSLEKFLNRFDQDIIESDDSRTPEELRGYFSKIIGDTIAPRETKERAVSQVNGFIRGYEAVQGLWSNFIYGEEERPVEYDELGIPDFESELRYAFPGIMMKLLLRNAGIMEVFVSQYPQEERMRIADALIAHAGHPLGMNKHRDFSWRSDRGVYTVGQNIHGDVSFAFHKNIACEQDFFSRPSTALIEGTSSESLHIYQYTESLVAAICGYSLHTGHIPEELAHWQKISENTESVIPNATTSDPMHDDPEHIAIMNGWGKAQRMDRSGEYLYLGNTVFSHPPDRYVTALLRSDFLIFAQSDEDGDIDFSDEEGRGAGFRKTLELTQSDIGPALRALFHLPGRSSANNRTMLSAYDWAKDNGYMSKL